LEQEEIEGNAKGRYEREEEEYTQASIGTAYYIGVIDSSTIQHNTSQQHPSNTP